MCENTMLELQDQGNDQILCSSILFICVFICWVFVGICRPVGEQFSTADQQSHMN